MRGAIREFIEATTSYKVCDAVDNDVSVIHKARESRCDLVLLHLATPLQDSLVTVSVLRSKLPHVKIVGFSTLSIDTGDLSPANLRHSREVTRGVLGKNDPPANVDQTQPDARPTGRRPRRPGSGKRDEEC